MFKLTVPVIVTIIGEGGSGGAIGLGVGNKVLIMENAYYSVITPEGCAAILWKDRKFAPQAAEALKITAGKLYELGVVDAIVPEPLGGAHRDHEKAAELLKAELEKSLAELEKLSGEELKAQRYEKFRKFGCFETEKIELSEEDSVVEAPEEK
jgi:acetyl-CoA carboxylase carboxyl transferase subunit alpha